MSDQAQEKQVLPLDFWKFWLGHSITQLGSAASAFVLPLIGYELTGSVLSLAVVAVVTFLPYPLFGLLIGAWVDRRDRRRLMVILDLLRAALQLSLPLAAVLGGLNIWLLYLIGFLNSTLAVAFDAAGFAAVPSLVEGGTLVKANTRLTSGVQLATILGPSAAAFLLINWSALWVLVFDAATYLVSAYSLLLVRRSFNPAGSSKRNKGGEANLWASAMEGLRFLWRLPLLRTIVISLALFNFFNAPIQAQIIAFLKNELAASDAEVGLYYTVEGIGMLVLPLATARLQHWGLARLTIGVLLAVGIANTLLPLLHSYAYTLLAGAFTAGLGTMLIISTVSLRQQLTPSEMYSRVAATSRTLSWSSIPLGNLVFGAFSEWSAGLNLTYFLMGVGCTLIPLVIWPLMQAGGAERSNPQPLILTDNPEATEGR